MKTLQSNFTTPEQSKRLLELGVPEWTADCFYKLDLYSFKTEMCFTKEDSLLHHYTPCWSVGRLIEIILLCPHRRNITISKGYNPIESLINQLVMLREVGTDFSKLEE